VAINPSGTATFFWVYEATSNGTVRFSSSAWGQDVAGDVFSNTTTATDFTMAVGPTVVYGGAAASGNYFPDLVIQPSMGLPALVTSQLVTPMPASLNQVVTVRLTLSNVGSSDIVSLTPTVSVASNGWASGVVQSVVPSVVYPMANGQTGVWDVLVLVSSTAAPSGAAQITLNFGAAYNEAQVPTQNRVVAGMGSVVIDVQAAQIATNHGLVNECFLSANYFRPSSQSLTLYVSVKKDSRVRIRVYNVAAELVRTVLDTDLRASADPNNALLYSGATDARLIWDGRADDGRPVSSGTYLISFEIEADGYRTIKKVNVLR